MYSTRRHIEYERQRTEQRQAEERTKFIQGLFFIPVFFLGPFIILWLITTIFK